MMKSVKIPVTRLYIAFGYYIEYYETVDGDRAGSGLYEIWVGKDSIGVKEFTVQADFSEESELGKDYVLQNIFAAAIVDFNSKFDASADEEDMMPLDGCGVRELEYEITRYYVKDDYYYDIDTANPWELEDLDGVKTVFIGKVNSHTKVNIFDFTVDEEVTQEDEESYYKEMLNKVLEEISEIFDVEPELLDLDTLKEKAEVEKYGIYYSLSDTSTGVEHSGSEEDEVTF